MAKKTAGSILRAICELGFRQAFWYGIHKAGIYSGLTRKQLPMGGFSNGMDNFPCNGWKHIPAPAQLADVLGDHQDALIQQANEIVSGRVRLFGAAPVDLALIPDQPLLHALDYGDRVGKKDIKFVWEPARFGWVFPLGRAYTLTKKPLYADAFWSRFEEFVEHNPLNAGPNWTSAQEVALRMGGWLFAASVFQDAPSSTVQRMNTLAAWLFAHAARIPPTVNYARAQNNNHLLSEALGLLLAGDAFEGSRESANWRRMGRRLMTEGLRLQVADDGTYAQHSTNYHRMMLSLVMWATNTSYSQTLKQNAILLEKIRQAARWLIAQIDPLTGYAPNLGSNDGSEILPLSICDFDDYRPAAQAASRVFLGNPAFEPGPWDEFSLWLGLPLEVKDKVVREPTSIVHRIGNDRQWATLRAVRFVSRPSHADQLHLDLWWEGINIARDAGTYSYNQDPPWENSLAGTRVHNTVLVDGLDQMERTGKFLWLRWAQAKIIAMADQQIIAEHDGYRRLGVIHRRSVEWDGISRWTIMDDLLPVKMRGSHQICLHWLVADQPWDVRNHTISLQTTHGVVEVNLSSSSETHLSIIRAGKIVYGKEMDGYQVDGWWSPTYGVLKPALGINWVVEDKLPIWITTTWQFPVLPGNSSPGSMTGSPIIH